jgi:peptidoglycan/xylan/chitin deacetylase (PgdA/CDA1 family)
MPARTALLVARAAAATFSLLGVARRLGAAVFAYHDVAPDASGPRHVTPAQLTAQLELADERGWVFVPLSTIVERIENGDAVDGYASITFDDARSGVVEHALPYLVERQFPATIFMITEPTDPSQHLSDDAVREAIAAGVTLGSHGRTHESLPALDDAALADELHRSRAALEDRFGVDVEFVSYPYGHVDRRVVAAAAAAGYRAGFTFRNGKVATDQDLLTLPRLTMGPHHTRRRLDYHLARGPRAWS